MLFGATTLGVGAMTRIGTGDWTPLVLALAAIGCQILVERSPVRHKRWWSSPAAHLLILTPFVIADWPATGLAVVAIYAFATLAAAVEGSREKA